MVDTPVRHRAATSLVVSAFFFKFLGRGSHPLAVLVRHALLIDRLGYIIEGHNLRAKGGGREGGRCL